MRAALLRRSGGRGGAVAGAGAAAGGPPDVGRWGALPGNCPTGGYDSLNDAPFLGNAGLGVIPCGAALNPKERSPNHTVFYLASNEFWGSNAVPDGRPATVTSEPFAQARIGDVTLIAPALTRAKYAASMDLRNAEVNITMVADGCNVTSSSIVGAADNLLITRLAVGGSGCGEATVVLASGDAEWARRSGAPGGAPLLPSGSGVARDGTPWIYRESVTETENSVTAST